MNRLFRSFWIGLLILACTACPRQPANKTPSASPTPPPAAEPSPTVHAPRTTSTPPPTPAPTPEPTPLPETFIPRSTSDTARLFNGLKIYSHLQSLPGGIAPLERTLDASYSVDISLTVKVPAPMITAEDFLTANPGITQAVPTLPELLKNSRVSSYYHALYALKVKSLEHDLRNLNDLLSRHNFFDCGTILELTNPATKRKALLLQADMDVVTDGSDSDRFLEVDGTSLHYQPSTSYRWPKLTPNPSQFLAARQAATAAAQAELALPALPAERARVLRNTIATNKLEIADLQTFSFLIAKADPFIVLPGFILRNRSLPFCPRIGDYAAVIYGSKIYPAIFGDVGPAVKVGEASLRLATTLNARSDANNRPTNKLDVSYLIFPQTAEEKPGPPDYEKWHTRCVELLTELGAPDLPVEHWENILPPLPTPTPPPAPDPASTLPTPKPLATPIPSPL